MAALEAHRASGNNMSVLYTNSMLSNYIRIIDNACEIKTFSLAETLKSLMRGANLWTHPSPYSPHVCHQGAQTI